MYFYDAVTDEFYFKDKYSVVPEGSREIDEDAKDFYQQNRGKYKIDLTRVGGDKITLEKVKTQGIDPMKFREVELREVEQRLLKILDQERLDAACGVVKPVAMALGISEKDMLVAERKRLKQIVEG